MQGFSAALARSSFGGWGVTFFYLEEQFDMNRILALCLLVGSARGICADEPNKLPFDWRGQVGDVTKEMARNQQGLNLNLGRGSIVLTDAVRLSKALVIQQNLMLTLTVTENEQEVRFERLIGATGTYSPHEWKSRPITITATPHRERFVRKGTLILKVPSGAEGTPEATAGQAPAPGQYKPFPTTPSVTVKYPPSNTTDVPTKNKTQAAYAVLAQELTQNYRLNGNEVKVEPSPSLMANLAKNDAEPQLRQAAAHIAALYAKGVDRLEYAKRSREIDIKNAQEMSEKAKRGEYVRTETVETIIDSFGTTRTKTYTIDENDLCLQIATARLRGAQNTRDLDLRNINEAETAKMMHQARSHAWAELIPAMPEKFAGAVSEQALVTVRFMPWEVPILPNRSHPAYSTGESERFQGKYLAKNVSGKRLQNVTLAVDFYHFSTGELATVRHVYFVPRWNPGEDLELSRLFKIDRKQLIGVLYQTPQPGHVNDPPHFELDGMAGVTKMGVAVWADEAKQPVTTTKFPERMEKIAPVLLTCAEKILLNPPFDFTGKAPNRAATLPPALRPMPIRPAPKLAKSPEELIVDMVAPILLPIVRNMPEKSEYSVKARRYLGDPKTARAELAKAQGKK